MIKALKNTTGSPIFVSDTGISIPASPAVYTIPEQDYLLWAASQNVISPINAGSLVVNDGVNDLTAARGLLHLSMFNAGFITGYEVDSSTIADQRKLVFDSATNKFKFIAESPGSAAGAKGEIQYRGNTAGSFAASPDLHWSETKNALTVGPEPTSLNNLVFSGVRSANTFIQNITQNLNSGTQATTDIVAENNLGTDDLYYADLGINSSGYNDPQYPLSVANDSYLYCIGGHLTVGTADRQFGTGALKDLIFHTGGFTLADERMRFVDAVNAKDAYGKLTCVLKLDANTTANRPTTPQNGMIRYNTTDNKFEGYENGAWTNFGSGGGGGEANTASNVGAGQGIFKQKVGVDLQFKSLVAGANISITQQGANELLIQATTGTASGIVNYNVTSSTVFSTTSLTDVLITGFTVTPASGTYAVWFNARSQSSNGSATNNWQIYKAGSAVTDSLRGARYGAASTDFGISTMSVIQVNGSQAIDVRVRTTNGTLSVYDRSLLLIRLGD